MSDQSILIAGGVTFAASTVARLDDASGPGGVLREVAPVAAGSLIVTITLQLFGRFAPTAAVGIAWLAALTSVTFAADEIGRFTNTLLQIGRS